MAEITAFFKTIWDALLSFEFPSDLFDIVFVTFIIYEGIKFIRGSRSFQLIKGIVFIALVFFFVKLTRMEASEYLLSSVIENALIVLVVLFAPEIRNILERFGRRSITDFSLLNFRNNGAYKEEITALVNDFCKAAGEMSETKTGALVVFEREALLSEVIKSGTVLDARSSVELFNGIFFKNSALHDGAVVVKNAKIYSAGCILPLTQNTAISSDLGTRHRAAIGMSEQTDAVVVVVSEETGGISVAINGNLQREVQTGKLREILLSNLVNDTEKDSRFFKKVRGEKSDKG